MPRAARAKDPGDTRREAERQMQAFDSLPADVRNWLRSANLGWDAALLKRRFLAAQRRKTARWGVERLLCEYQAQDSGQ